jgi:hypothetical protein
MVSVRASDGPDGRQDHAHLAQERLESYVSHAAITEVVDLMGEVEVAGDQLAFGVGHHGPG